MKQPANPYEHLNRHYRRRFHSLQTRLENGTIGDRATVTCLPAPEAMLHDRYGQGACEFMILAFGTAKGELTRQRECATCCQPWTLNRVPVVIYVVEWLKGDAALMGGLCGACADGDMWTATIIKTLEREGVFTRGSARLISDGGQA